MRASLSIVLDSTLQRNHVGSIMTAMAVGTGAPQFSRLSVKEVLSIVMWDNRFGTLRRAKRQSGVLNFPCLAFEVPSTANWKVNILCSSPLATCNSHSGPSPISQTVFRKPLPLIFKVRWVVHSWRKLKMRVGREVVGDAGSKTVFHFYETCLNGSDRGIKAELALPTVQRG